MLPAITSNLWTLWFVNLRARMCPLGAGPTQHFAAFSIQPEGRKFNDTAPICQWWTAESHVCFQQSLLASRPLIKLTRIVLICNYQSVETWTWHWFTTLAQDVHSGCCSFPVTLSRSVLTLLLWRYHYSPCANVSPHMAASVTIKLIDLSKTVCMYMYVTV